MNKDLTLVFSSYQSQHLLKKILLKFDRKYKIIIIENSLDKNIKKFLENKFKNVEVIIPKKNLGLARSYNLGINKSKTKYVFLNNADIEISDISIKKLLKCAKNLKNFGAISPRFKDEKIYKNYEIFTPKKNINSKFIKKNKICEVDILDNNFLIEKKSVQKSLFDENYFLYYETFDFTFNLKKKGKKLYVVKKINFQHLGTSLPSSLANLVRKTRSFHYNWSKFYYFKKNFSYLFAIRKILPNIIKAIKKICIGFMQLDSKTIQLASIELLGIFSSILLFKSFYRPKN